MKTDNELIENLGKLHTTKMGLDRIKQNLGLKTDDVVEWCRRGIGQADEIIRAGKNWYVSTGDCVITVNAGSYTIITAHKMKREKSKMEGLVESDLKKAYETVLSMIHKLEKTQEKLKPETPQWTTCVRRLNALRLAMSLITKELRSLGTAKS